MERASLAGQIDVPSGFKTAICELETWIMFNPFLSSGEDC